jgi:hypothetical protein
MDRGFRVAAALVAALVLPASAAAQAPASEAQRLFQRGRELYDTKRFDEACQLLAQSDRLDPAVGTLGLLASCEEERGRLAAAHRAYRETAERAARTGDPRGAFARERADKLAERLGFVKVRASGAQVGLEIVFQGERLRTGDVIAVEPGRHTVTARAPGKREALLTVTVGAGQTVELAIPELEALDAPPRAPVASSPGSVGLQSGWPLQRTLGWVGVGVGGAGVLVGMVAGGVVLVKQSTLDNDPGCPDACRDRDAVSSFNAMRGVSTAGFIAGGVVLAAGVVLVLTAPSSSARAVAADGRGLVVDF